VTLTKLQVSACAAWLFADGIGPHLAVEHHHHRIAAGIVLLAQMVSWRSRTALAGSMRCTCRNGRQHRGILATAIAHAEFEDRPRNRGAAAPLPAMPPKSTITSARSAGYSSMRIVPAARQQTLIAGDLLEQAVLSTATDRRSWCWRH
jgi:hypothetical protein